MYLCDTIVSTEWNIVERMPILINISLCCKTNSNRWQVYSPKIFKIDKQSDIFVRDVDLNPPLLLYKNYVDLVATVDPDVDTIKLLYYVCLM